MTPFIIRVENVLGMPDQDPSHPAIPEEGPWAELVAYSSDIMTIIDDNGTILFQSPAVEHILGYDREALVGEYALEYVHPNDHDRASETLSKVFEAEKEVIVRAQYRFRHADGSWVWLETTGSHRKHSTIDGYVLNSRDISERKHHERELDRRTKQLSSVLNSIESVVWMRDTDHRFLVMNDHYRELFDIDPDVKVEGKTPEDIVDDDLAKQFRSHDQVAIEAGELVSFEERAEIGGEEVYALTKVTPLYDEGGDIFAVCGVATEITEQRERERELRERNKELNALHQISQSFATEDGPSEELLAKFVHRVPEWFQYPEHAVIHITFGEHTFVSAPMAGDPVFESSEPVDDDSSVSVAYGWKADAPNNLELLSDEQRLIATITRLLAETIGRREQERALDLFKQAIEDVAQGVMITDTENNIEYVNPAFEKQTGYAEGELIGKEPRIFRSGKHEESTYEDIQSTIQSGDIWEGELIHKRRDESLYYVNVTVSPMIHDGEVSHFVSLWADITDRRIREQQLDVLNRLLRHNLRNSLTVIGGYASLIAGRDIDETVGHSVDVIQDHVARLSSLSEKNNRIRSFIDQVGVRDEGVDLNAMLHRLESKYQDQVQLTVAYPERVQVQGDEHLETAFEELIENAIVHNSNGNPAIRVGVDTSGSLVEVSISDNGPGMPQDQRRVIERGIETPLAHGSGLGLWIVYWIVTKIGGEVDFGTSESGGTEAILRIPRANGSDDS